jgi:hypothetical protein
MNLRMRFIARLTLLITLFLPFSARAESIISAQGVASIEGDNVAQAENLAMQDAFHKAIIQESVRNVPQSSVFALLKKLPIFLSSRGTQDISQYKITARTQQGSILSLTVEFRVNDVYLRDWISAQNFTVPSAFRPRILLAVSCNAPGEGLHEWWYLKGKKGYALFESQLALELAQWGENVFKEAPELGVLASGADPLILALKFKADLLIQGSVWFTTLGGNLYQCTLNLNLIDVNTKASLGAWSLTRRGDLSVQDMYAVLISSLLEDLRTRIAQRIVKIAPMIAARQVCIEGIRDFGMHQKLLDALSGLDGVEDIEINTIQGHSICHTIRIKGRLEDIMQNLKSKRIADIDIQVKDDTAHIVINP